MALYVEGRSKVLIVSMSSDQGLLNIAMLMSSRQSWLIPLSMQGVSVKVVPGSPVGNQSWGDIL